MAVKITKHAFEYGAMKYFRGNANSIELCSFGEKKDPIGPKAYLAVEAKVARKHLEGRVNPKPPVEIDWSRQSQVDVDASGPIPYFGIDGKFAINANYKKASRAKLKLMQLIINERPLKVMLNQDANAARNYLADEGKDGRIVSEIWVVLEGELASEFSGNVDVSASGSGLELSVGVGRRGSHSIVLSEGATFAYRMHKVKDWNRGKTKIEDMEDDSKGNG